MGFIVHRAREGFVFALLAVIGIAAPAQGAAYTILDLGTLGGTASGTYGQNVLNASGQVVGVAATTGDAAYHAFRTPANAPIVQGPGGSDLGTLGDVYIEAYGINASGQAVGYSSGPIPQSSFEHAFRTAANGAIVPGGLERGTLVGTGNSAYGINASGQVVGYAASTTGNHAHAFRTAPNGPIVQGAGGSDLGTLGGLNSYAFGINDSGQAVGYSSIMFTGDPEHAFRTAPNGPIVQGPGGSDLGTLGGQKSFATAVNNSGQTVGFSDTPVYGEHAFRTAANGPIVPGQGAGGSDLGTLGGGGSQAYGINSSGQVVGYSYTSRSADPRAFIADVSGPMVDLNTLIDPALGWVLNDARGINDSGQIAGYGTIGGHHHAFLMTPATTPPQIVAAGNGNTGHASGGSAAVNGMDATLANVTVKGALAVNVSYPTLTGLQSITGPLPSEVRATLADGTYLLANLSFDGSFAGGATVTFHYDPNRLSSDLTASQLEILHFNGTTWDNLGGTLDPVADTISFTTPSLSPFVLVATPEPASLCLLALGGMALTHRNRRRRV